MAGTEEEVYDLIREVWSCLRMCDARLSDHLTRKSLLHWTVLRTFTFVKACGVWDYRQPMNFFAIAHVCLQVTKGSEILEVLHSLPKIKRYLFSLYDCHYSDFFLSLGKRQKEREREVMCVCVCMCAYMHMY